MSHIVVGKRVGRVKEGTAPQEVQWFEVGAEIEPTEAELSAFPDRFREVDTPKRGPGRPPRQESPSAAEG